MTDEPDDIHDETLEEAATHLLEETRMVLPGIQALFGFQLIGVFSDVFHTRLTVQEQLIHLSAIGLNFICIALVLAPAAYHRQVEPMAISRRFIRVSSVILTIAMGTLLLAICLDFYLVAELILHTWLPSLVLTGLIGGATGVLWFVCPRLARSRRSARHLG